MATTVLKISCPDRVGLLSRLCGFFAERGGNLVEVHQFTDPVAGWFFARMAVNTATLGNHAAGLKDEFSPLAAELSAEWSLRPAEQRQRVVLMASKQGHCLADLLWRWRSGELAFDLAAVVANHEDLRPLAEREGVPFFHVPFPNGEKDRAFAEVARIWTEVRADLVVLARFMQVVPGALCEAWRGRLMNIHHSFLPSFAGANPYQRAHERGVKLIGATCHYVTTDLDAGPIVDQEVTRVEHFHTPDDLVRLGRDCERIALARGVRWHLADRVLLHGNRTVVFRD